MKVVLSLATLLFTAASVLACDGPEPEPYAVRFKHAESVAIVRVISLVEVRGKPGHVEGRARVVEVLKGAFSETVPVYAYTPNVDCYSPVALGRDYVVFLPNSAGRSEVWFSMFSTTERVTEIPPKLLSSWRKKS